MSLPVLEEQISLATRSGKYVAGYREVYKSLSTAHVEVVIIAKNAPQNLRREILDLCQLSETPFIEYQGMASRLGRLLGRRHPVAFVAFRSIGDSNLLEVLKDLGK